MTTICEIATVRSVGRRVPTTIVNTDTLYYTVLHVDVDTCRVVQPYRSAYMYHNSVIIVYVQLRK